MKKLRKELNRLIEKYGLTHPIVIEYSNKLNNAILPIQIKRLEKYKEISNEWNNEYNGSSNNDKFRDS